MYWTSSFVMLISLLYKVISVIWKIPGAIGIVSKCLLICLTSNFHRNLVSLGNILSGKSWLRGSWSWTHSIHWYSPGRLRRITVLTQPISGWNLSLSLLYLRDTLNILDTFLIFSLKQTNKNLWQVLFISTWGLSKNTLRSWNFWLNLHRILFLVFCTHHAIHFMKVYPRLHDVKW